MTGICHLMQIALGSVTVKCGMNIESCEHCGYPLTSGNNELVPQVCDIHIVVFTKFLLSQLFIKNYFDPIVSLIVVISSSSIV